MPTISDKIRSGELKLYALEKNMPAADAVAARREYISEETGVSLSAIGDYTIPVDRVTSRNIENMIGCVQVPLGAAGPLVVCGEYASGAYWLPLATTEGALVASVNRGCSAIAKAGGAEVRIFKDGMARAPVFAAEDIPHAARAAAWIEANLPVLKAAAAATTSHGTLVSLTTYTAGTSVYVRLVYDTQDAMGMNMATIASEAVAGVIEQETGLRFIAASGNMCCDKKPAAINVVEGRGKTVSAGVFLSADLVRSALKTEPELLCEVNTRKNLVGSARAAALGFNAHAANVVAALFLACGQDAAHVVEGSNCITTVDPAAGGVYVAVTLPSLQVGTVGGGTSIACQHEALSLLGCAGGNGGCNAKKFAEIAACGVLAGELSLLAALASKQLGKAHQALGRG